MMTYTPVFYALYPNGRPGAYRRWGEYAYLPGDKIIGIKCEPVVSGGGGEERAPSRVRVHFFESGALKCPSAAGGSVTMDVSADGQLLNGSSSHSYFRETQQQVFTTSTPNGTSVRTVTYTARQSTDSGIDNPFRPEGELSMEADEIVKAIKEGRPFDSIDSGRVSRQDNSTSLSIETKAAPLNGSPVKAPKNSATKNGSAKSPPAKKQDAKPGVVDVQRGVISPPSEAQQAEAVVIKKKPKCKCCVIQ